MESADVSIGPAAGMVRTFADFEKVLDSAATEATIGTVMEKPRQGNLPAEGGGRVYYFDDATLTSYNALGLPDHLGMEGYVPLLPKMVTMAEERGKRLRMSIGVNSNDNELGRLAFTAFALGAHEVEYNASCPNIRSDGRKMIPSYEPAELRRQLVRLSQYQLKRRISLKLGPVGHELIIPLCRVIIETGVVDRIVAVNTVPNQSMTLPDGTPALDYYGDDTKRYHTGGMGGAAAKKEGLRVVRGFVEALKELSASETYRDRASYINAIAVTGVGGIFSGDDAAEYIDAGARGVQVATAYYEYGPKVFGEIASGM